jgi:hypothetical protein
MAPAMFPEPMMLMLLMMCSFLRLGGDHLPVRDRASPLLRVGEEFPGLHADETC